ncbi:hypothetical protein MMC31_008062 [Peltigera leucophlebia]|nr:hypothetical protein [Peltigera leucophlebia]
MYASEQSYRINTTIAHTHTTPALLIRLLKLESQYCKQARSVIALEISAKQMEYNLLVARTRANMMTWEVRGPILGNMAQKHADAIADLHDEYVAFGDAKDVADAYIARFTTDRTGAVE